MELFTEKETQSKDPLKNKVLINLVLEKMRNYRSDFFDNRHFNKSYSNVTIKNLIYDLHHMIWKRVQDPSNSFHIDSNIKVFPSDEAFAEYVENNSIQSNKYSWIFNNGSYDERLIERFELLNLLEGFDNHPRNLISGIRDTIQAQLPDHNLILDDFGFTNPFLKTELNLSDQVPLVFRKIFLQIKTLRISDYEKFFDKEDFYKNIPSYWYYRAMKYIGVIYSSKQNNFIHAIIDLYNYASKVFVDGYDYYIIKKPKIYLDISGQELHNSEGIALEFEDGTGSYFRNGFLYPSWVFDNDRSKFKAKMILDIKNGSVRKDAIEEFGIEEFLKVLDSEIIDKNHDYQLVLVNIGRRKCEFLKMINPSTGQVHIEGVRPGIRTIEEAINWRLNIKSYKGAKFSS